MAAGNKKALNFHMGILRRHAAEENSTGNERTLPSRTARWSRER
jgi:hypothetical protein